MMHKFVRVSVTVLTVLICLASAGIATYLQGATLVSWWKPLSLCVAAAAIVTALWHRWPAYLTGVSLSYVNIAVGMAVTTSLATGAVYVLNYYGSDAGSACMEKVTVIRKYSEVHYRSRRVSRHSNRQEPYNVYYMTVMFEDGRTKDVRLTINRYTSIHKGQQYDYTVEDGLLGMPVIKDGMR